jgi:hypothetical protein
LFRARRLILPAHMVRGPEEIFEFRLMPNQTERRRPHIDWAGYLMLPEWRATAAKPSWALLFAPVTVI